MFTLLIKLFFGFILAALLVALFFIVALVTGVLSLFRKNTPKKNNSQTYTNAGSNTYGQSNTDYQQPSGGQQKKKIIPQDEGEYVDFEEVDPS